MFVSSPERLLFGTTMQKDPSKPTPDSKLGRKKKYTNPQFAKLTPEEAKVMLRARGMPDSPVIRQLLESIGKLEKRPGKK